MTSTRKYLPTFADLIDRLSICQLKQIFLSEHKETYTKEISDIIHDLNLIIKEKEITINGKMIRQILMIMLTNRYIWENESKARKGKTQDLLLLKHTHSINGVRNNAKNIISQEIGEKIDLKIDCMAADLPKEFGNWKII